MNGEKKEGQEKTGTEQSDREEQSTIIHLCIKDTQTAACNTVLFPSPKWRRYTLPNWRMWLGRVYYMI